jgi:hypothetical protein
VIDFSTQVQRPFNGGKIGYLITGYPKQKRNLDFHFTVYKKNIGANLHNLGFMPVFLPVMPNAQTTKEKVR